MAVSTNISGLAPYYDDFNSSGNDNKNYLRILFKPGVAVQTRELNQLQTAIQNQIDKLGRHVFQENSRVLGGDFSVNTDVDSIDITLLSGYNTDSLITSNLLNKEISNADDTITATVVGFQNLTGSVYKLFLRYTKVTDTSSASDSPSGTFQTPIYSKTFSSGDLLDISGTSIGTIDAVGIAVQYILNEGVFFTKGSFVVASAQSAFLDTGSEKLSYDAKPILTVTESFVNVNSDSTLYDNALGTPNTAAPGADRYAISLDLKVLTNNSTLLGLSANSNIVLQESSFTGDLITLGTVTDSTVVSSLKNTYNELGDFIARRTFEESGNYTLRPYLIELKEHLSNSTNGGRYSATEGGSDSLISVSVGASTAYLNGKRIEHKGKSFVDLNKARETYTGVFNQPLGQTIQIQAKKGNYIEGTEVFGIFQPDTTYELYGTTRFNASRFDTLQAHPADTAEGQRLRDKNPLTGREAFFDSSPSILGLSSLDASPSLAVGQCKVTAVEFDGNKFRAYLSNVQLAPGFELKDATFLADSAFTFGVNDFFFDAGPKSEGFVLKDTKHNSDIYPLGKEAVKDIYELRYVERSTSSTISRSSGTSVVLPIASSGGSGSTGTTFFSDNNNDYIVFAADTVGAVIAGTQLKLGTTAPSITDSGATVTLTLATATTSDVIVISSKQKTITDFSGGRKDLESQTDNKTLTSLTTNERLTLTKTDIYGLTKITADGIDITNEFVLDNGQTRTSYNTGAITYIGSARTLTGDTNNVAIEYQYFNHATTTQPFTVESFAIDGFDNQNPDTVKINYNNTPRILNIYDSSDVVDFRATSGLSVDPNSLIQARLDYYLPRQSSLVLAEDGHFEMIDGKSSLKPVAPVPPENSLLLYNFDLPAYTKLPKAIGVEDFKYRRYTMRDIGDLEKRIHNLEYYTSLSLLENDAKGKSISDDEGERFKNGIFTDDFGGHNKGNVRDPGYQIATDQQQFVLRPACNQTNMNVFLTNRTPEDASGITGGNQAESHARLNVVTRQTLIDQPRASTSISVNPYNLTNFTGNLELSPSSDEWKSTEALPDVVKNFDGLSDHLLVEFTKNSLDQVGMSWGDWTYNWHGQIRKKTVTHHRDREFNGFEGWETRKWNQTNLYVENYGEKSKVGTRTFIDTREDKIDLGTKVIGTDFIPFLRSRFIYFKATDMKPNTRVIPFFDGINVDIYSRQSTAANYLTYIDGQNNKSGEPKVNSKSEGVKPIDILSASSPGLITDSSGDLFGYFFLPNTEELRFRTLDIIEFQLIDSTIPSDVNATTRAEASYYGVGSKITTQKDIVSTRVPFINTERETYTTYANKVIRNDSYNYKLSRIISQSEEKICYTDPIAQSFIIGNYETGVYIRDIDLFFKDVDSSLSVKIDIRTMENGVPTQNVVPGSRVRKTATEMTNQGSDTAATATNFRFEKPLYLNYGVEYCIVVTSNSANYTLWHATVGQNDVSNTNIKIDKNPYAGVSFKSSNQSTWTEDQNTDFKFKINFVTFAQDDELVKNFTTILPEDVFGAKVAVGGCSAVVLLAEDINHPNTSIEYLLTDNSGVSPQTYSMTPGETTYLPSQITSVSSANTLQLSATLKTSSEFVTPEIDLERISLLVVDNVINNTIAGTGDDVETHRTHGPATSRYISRIVPLENASTRLDVYLDVSRPKDTNVKVFGRFNNSGNSTEAFVELSSDPIPFTSIDTGDSMEREGTFKEVHFIKDFQNEGIARGDESAIETFDQFEVKIVLLSSDAAVVPMCKNLRSVATV